MNIRRMVAATILSLGLIVGGTACATGDSGSPCASGQTQVGQSLDGNNAQTVVIKRGEKKPFHSNDRTKVIKRGDRQAGC